MRSSIEEKYDLRSFVEASKKISNKRDLVNNSVTLTLDDYNKLVNLQSSEIQRLVNENERIVDELESDSRILIIQDRDFFINDLIYNGAKKVKGKKFYNPNPYLENLEKAVENYNNLSQNLIGFGRLFKNIIFKNK